MRPPKLIPAQISFSVHFMESAIPQLDEASQRLQRRAMEAIQRAAWGDRHRDFARLMKSDAFLPKVPVDPVFFVPVADGLRMVAMEAVKAWNLCDFPLRFDEAWESIKGPDKMTAMSGGAGRRMALADMDVEGAPDPWTCVVWEWRNGEYVPTYNYRVAPAPPTGGSSGAMAKGKARMAKMTMMDDEEMPSVFDDIIPGSELMAVYEFHIALRLKFPLPDSTPLPSAREKAHVMTPAKKTRGASKAKAKAKTAKRTSK